MCCNNNKKKKKKKIFIKKKVPTPAGGGVCIFIIEVEDLKALKSYCKREIADDKYIRAHHQYIFSLVSNIKLACLILFEQWINILVHWAKKIPEILRFEYDKEDSTNLPYWEIALFLYMTNVALIVAKSVPKTGSSWAYDLFYTIVGGFGGGILNPVLLCMDSHFPFPMASDIVIPLVFTSWYCLHYVPYYYELVELPFIKHIVLIGFECVRAFFNSNLGIESGSMYKT